MPVRVRQRAPEIKDLEVSAYFLSRCAKSVGNNLGNRERRIYRC
jgi:hypothetical protein